MDGAFGGGKTCLILGDGSQTMDFVFVEDIARANTMAAESSITDDVINVASGVETSLTELAETLGRVMGVNLAARIRSRAQGDSGMATAR